MDPISGNKSSNPTNNPRLDLLHNTGDNQQLNGVAGSYGPSGGYADAAAPKQPSQAAAPALKPQAVVPEPKTPEAAAPKSASDYVAAAQANRAKRAQAAPTPVSTPTSSPSSSREPVMAGSIPSPRPASSAPLYAGVGATAAADDGGIGITGLIIGVVLMLVVMGGMYGIFSSQINKQNQQLQSALDQIKSGQQAQGDLSVNSINDSGSLTAKTLTVTDAESGVDGLTVNGSSNLQGPVKMGQDLTVAGTVTAQSFVGDGSQLTGISGGSGPAGPAGPAGATGPAGAPNPNAVSAVTATNCTTCVKLQADTPGTVQTGNMNISGNGNFGGAVSIGNQSVTAGGDLNISNASATAVLTHTNSASASGLYLGEADPQTLSEIDQSAVYQLGSTATVGANSLNIANLTTTGDIVFTTNGGDPNVNGGTVEGLRITAAGNVGLGSAAPTHKLEVNGTLLAGATNVTSLVSGGAINGGAITGTSLNVGSGQIDAGVINGTTINANTFVQGGVGVCDDSQNCNGYIKNQTASAQSGSFWIDGSVNVGTTGPFGPTAVIGSSGDITSVGNGQFNTLHTTGNVGGVGLTIDQGFISIAGKTGVSTTGCTGGHYSVTEITGGVVTQAACVANGSGQDYAERYNSTQALSAGEVVAIDPANAENVVMASSSNQLSAIGIVSTNPGETIGSGNVVVAEAGRVPVKINSENGPIAAGDYLTSSSTPGVARKANPGEHTIGIAMTAGSSGTVTAFVNVGVAPGGAVQAAQQSVSQGSTSLADINVSGTSTFDNIVVNGTATIADLKVTGTAEVATLKVNGHIIGNSDTRGVVTVPAGATTVHHAFATAYSATPVVVASPVTASASYHVTETASGFDIDLDTPAAAALDFNYLVQQ